MRYAAALLLALFFAACASTQQSPERYVRTHDRPRAIEQAIMNGKVTTGMTKEEVRLSWGKPQNKYHQGAGAPTQWCYSNGARCLTFKNGKVSDWE